MASILFQDMEPTVIKANDALDNVNYQMGRFENAKPVIITAAVVFVSLVTIAAGIYIYKAVKR